MRVFGRWLPGWSVAISLALVGCTPRKTPPPTPDPSLPTTQGSASTPAPVPAPVEPEWTSSPVTQVRGGLPAITLREVRAAQHEGFERVVFQFDGDQVPGYRVGPLDTPAVRCGSGEAVTLAGGGRLQVMFQPAQAHAEGHSTVAELELRPALPLLEQLEQTCDFEGEVTWVLGVKQSHPFRVMELRGPARLVVDVKT